MRKNVLLVGPLALFALILSALTAPGPSVRADPKADFQTHVVGFLQKHCVGCHGEKTQRADLTLHKYTDAAAIIKDRKIWQNVVDQVHQGVMPPGPKKRPPMPEMDAFLGTVNTVFAEADRKARPDPGRVTVRRLNRYEYNATIRDLVGVDFNPAEDFPSDDVGHGFDNIGDVLTVSPLLIERYLAAAESILARAITVDPPKPPRREISIQYTEPSSPKVPMKGQWRILSSAAGVTPVEGGPIHTPYQVPPDGEYTFRTRVYAEREGNKPVTVVVLAHGTTIPTPATKEEAEKIAGPALGNLSPFVILKTIEIKGRDEKTAETLTIDIPANIGLKRTAIGLLKTDDGPAAKLYVNYLALDGPKDTRPATQRVLLACNAEAAPRDKAKEILTRFATRAYRRPTTPDEIERLLKLYDASLKQGEKFEAGIVFAMQAVLVSPKFLFRVELDDRPDSTEPHPITDWQLASRLSYFIWGSMPDDELFDLAKKGELARNIEPQVKRMLASPKAKALVDNFAMQWLQLRTLKNLSPDPKLFPKFNDTLKGYMLKETELFLDALVKEDRGILDLIDAKFTFLNGQLAQHYGIADTEGHRWGDKGVRRDKPIPWDKFVRVEMPDPNRAGVLTHASVLTVTSNPTRTSPVKRGRWILDQILGTPPPPPPPNVPELDQKETKGTLRQRMEQHRENPSCASCHARMDPLGFAFENFDAVGAWRIKDGETAVDASGVLPDGKTFNGPAELKTILKEKKDLFAKCLSEKMLVYALGRGLEYYDRRAVDAIVASTRAHEYKLSALVTAIAQSDPFRLRRGKGTNP